MTQRLELYQAAGQVVEVWFWYFSEEGLWSALEAMSRSSFAVRYSLTRTIIMQNQDISAPINKAQVVGGHHNPLNKVQPVGSCEVVYLSNVANAPPWVS
jgi:hypothetical protein